MYFDELLREINGFGQFQLFALFVSSFTGFASSFNHMGIVLISALQPYNCDVSQEIMNTSGAWLNVSFSSDQCIYYVNESIPEVDDGGDGLRHKVTANQCTRWRYDTGKVGTTLLTTWDLVCDRHWLVSFSTSVYMAGLLVGLMPIAIVSDKYGRRRANLLALAGVTVMTLVNALSPNIYVYIVSRFCTGFFVQGLSSVNYSYALEVVITRRRLVAVFLRSLPWYISLPFMAGLGYLLRDWRNLNFVFVGLCAINFIIAYVFLLESARWLYASGRNTEADVIVRKMAKMNRTSHKLPDKIKITVTGTQKANTLDLFRTSEIRRRTLLVCYLWFASSLVFFGLYFSASRLAVDVYVNLCAGALFECGAHVVKLAAVSRFGRRRPGILVFVLAGVALLASLAFHKESVACSVLVIVGRVFSSISFSMAYLLSAELAPTVLRSNSLSVGSVCARVGGIIAPFIGNLDDIHPSISSLIFGSLAVVAGILIYMLPETRKTKLPDTVNDVIEMKTPRTDDVSSQHQTELLDNTLDL